MRDPKLARSPGSDLRSQRKEPFFEMKESFCVSRGAFRKLEGI